MLVQNIAKALKLYDNIFTTENSLTRYLLRRAMTTNRICFIDSHSLSQTQSQLKSKEVTICSILG